MLALQRAQQLGASLTPPYRPSFKQPAFPSCKYLVSERQRHDGDQKAKERLQFPQTCEEKETVSMLGRAGPDFPSRIPPEELPYLSRKRNTKVSAMVMSTPPHSGILRAGESRRQLMNPPPPPPPALQGQKSLFP